MFSKALFKQSCKANGIMWAIITVAVCFMLSCVILISGGGSIGEVKDSMQDTIIKEEIESQMEARAINYYNIANEGLMTFDSSFTSSLQAAMTYNAKFEAWLANEPSRSNYENDEEYASAALTWKNSMPQATVLVEQAYLKNFNDWKNSMPVQSDYETVEAYTQALTVWNASKPVGNTGVVKAAYLVGLNSVKELELKNAKGINKEATEDSTEYKELLGVVMYNINPSNEFDSFYTSLNEDVPSTYDVMSLVSNATDSSYLTSDERIAYITSRSEECSSIFLAGNMSSEENVNLMLSQLAKYNVTKEKYEAFGYNYTGIKHIAKTTLLSYKTRYEYEMKLINDKKNNGEYANEEAYKEAILTMQNTLKGDLSNSLLSSLPSSVSEALQEVGQMDLFGLIVGSIFFKMAGLLLPIIYLIMVSNNLIAGQVDSGSMAYVLSTSTKRKQVVFTQAIFLVGSLFAMFALTSITSCICLSQVLDKVETSLTYGKVLLFNLGAFIVLFAMSGICYFASCYFDRSKYSMSIGGGISMFFLVATMLGLFGSKVIPSIVRLDALNNFNYVSIISLFDTISIINGTHAFIWKLCILVVIGLVGYILGSIKFKKKDLPL